MNEKLTEVGLGCQSPGSGHEEAANSSFRFRRGLGVITAVLLAALLPRALARAAEPPNFAQLQRRVFCRSETVPAADEAVHDLAFSPDGRTLASCGEGWRGTRPDGGDDCVGQIMLWDVHAAKGRAVITREGIPTFTRLVFSPDGKTIVSGSYAPDGSNDGTIDFWDVASRRHIRQVKWPGTIVHSLAMSGDGRLLAAGGYRGEWVKDTKVLRIIDMQSGKDVARLEDGLRIVSLAFSPDNKLLVAAHVTGGRECSKWGNGLCGGSFAPAADFARSRFPPSLVIS